MRAGRQADDDPELELAAGEGVLAAGVGLEVELLDVVSLAPAVLDVLDVLDVSDVDVPDESADVVDVEAFDDECDREALASARASVR